MLGGGGDVGLDLGSAFARLHRLAKLDQLSNLPPNSKRKLEVSADQSSDRFNDNTMHNVNTKLKL